MGIAAPIISIDGSASLGLGGTANSLGYRVAELERHFHARERWFGKLGSQTATDWADDTLTPYRAISGDGAYGSDANDEAQVLGAADTPSIADKTHFDIHRIFITAVSVDTVYKLRIVYGTGTMADAVTAGQYSEAMVKFDRLNPQQSAGIPFDVMMPRCAVGTKVWVQAWNATNNATVDFFVGIHEYEG
jgi:hypothetical protein